MLGFHKCIVVKESIVTKIFRNHEIMQERLKRALRHQLTNVFLQVWSNDKYESVEHRVVVNSQKERLSIPFFLTPAFSVMVKPLKELLQEHDPPLSTRNSTGDGS